MKIGIDIHYLGCVNDMAGICQYIHNLALNLLAIDTTMIKFYFRALGGSGVTIVLFDPLNVNEMTGVTYNVLSNSSLKGQLVEKGFERAQYVSWEKTAREIQKLCQEIW
jgi:hypothetical protein